MKDATLGGIGLDWRNPPTGLDEVALGVWEHLAETFRGDPARFREGDRQAVAAYCDAVSQRQRAAAALAEHGVLVVGRSDKDKDRPVWSPAWAMWRDASTQVRQWSNELGLSPSSRARMKLPAPPADLDDNPFVSGEPH